MDKFIAKLDSQIYGCEQGGGAEGSGPSVWDGNSADGANDGGWRVRGKDDGDYFEEMLWTIGPEIILKSFRSRNLKRVKKLRRRV